MGASLYDDVYGLSYRAASEQMSIVEEAIRERRGNGFASVEELEEWARGHRLDKVLFSSMSHGFLCVSHKGEIITPQAFSRYYGDVLFWERRVGKRIETSTWTPGGFDYFDRAYIASEQSDGLHRPLYYRDYCVPTGYYDEERQAFNAAKPFPVFAKETGADTSHIYTYLEHVAGECAMWLLAWLRAKLLWPTVKTQVVPIIVSKSQGSGKGQPLRCRVLTPTGFRAIGELCDGDLVVSPADGKAYPVSLHNRGVRHVSKVTMSNGAVTWCDDLHIWQARTVSEQSRHKDFHEMPMSCILGIPLKKHYGRKGNGYAARQLFIPAPCPVAGTGRLPMAYAIGLFIGDGCCSRSSIFINEPDVYERCKASLEKGGYTLTQGKRPREHHYNVSMLKGTDLKFRDYLLSIGVSGTSPEKRLPDGFLGLCPEDRKELFEGLVDSDGYMSGSCNIDWSTSSGLLYSDMVDLASSIGLVVRRVKGKDAPAYVHNGERRVGKRSYRLAIKADDQLRLSESHRSRMTRVTHGAYVAFDSIEDAGYEECACLYVDSPDHLYVTDDWIVTHNTTFAEVICKGLFGKDNVLVTDQYDSQARFNADYADALIVCQEEKEEVDRRNPAGALKSRATATTIRKEKKGIDPIYQDSYTDFIMTTNKDVPIKFDGREDQRRFMIMEADEHFTRKESELADEVFTKLYGFDANNARRGRPFVEDRELIAQFKHELFTRADIAAVKLRNFPKTAAYRKCFTLPRTNEATEIEAIMRSIAPFIRQSLADGQMAEEYGDLMLKDVVQHTGALQYMPAMKGHPAFVAVCRPLVFYEAQTLRPLAHSTVERAIYDCAPWLLAEFGLSVIPDMEPLAGGFMHVAGRYRTSAAAKFCLAEDAQEVRVGHIERMDAYVRSRAPDREGERFRVGKDFRPDAGGCFETVNEMRPGTLSLKDKTRNVAYMDTLLFESDEATKVQEEVERRRAEEHRDTYGEGSEIKASVLYRERLRLAEGEARRLFDEGVVARVVYSGAKSYHLLVRMADSPQTLEEYRWLHAYLCQHLSDKVRFDESTSDPARLTRSPLVLPRVTTAYGLLVSGEQRPVLEDWGHVYGIRWRPLFEQWKGRPKTKFERRHGGRLFPCRKEYYEAAEAIESGEFWSDGKYDGERQRLFFPAYRLLRMGGCSHDDVFLRMLPEGLKGYAKQGEVGYWLARSSCSLIADIDGDIGSWEEEKDADDGEA